MSKYIKYDAFDRYARRKEFTNKRAALKHAKAEARDGWPSDVTDLRTGKTIWKSSGGTLEVPSRYTQRCQMIEEHGRLTSEEES